MQRRQEYLGTFPVDFLIAAASAALAKTCAAPL